MEKRQFYELSPKELREVQLIELEMIEEIDRICKKFHIHYCISAGTQLGAVRHHGFIPWDDDADIAFLRPEYEKFREACKTELDEERFYFQDYRNTEGYRWGYGKLRRRGTEFVRLYQEDMPYEQGVFVDIMPYDNVPDNYIFRKMHTLICFFYRKSFWAPLGKEQSKGLEKIAYQLLSLIPDDKLYTSYQRFIEKNNRKRTKRIRIYTLPVPGHEGGYLRSCFTHLVPIKFETLTVKGMRDYDVYLSYKYGKYMELPPKNKRKIHPVSQLKLVKID